MKKAKAERAPLSLIVAAQENQPRVKADKARIRRIADELRNGGEIRTPLVVVREACGNLTLYDGWHRYAAAVEAGASWVPVEITADAAEARRRAAEANQHGTEWSRHDAMRHAAQRARAGDFYNASPVGSTVPLSLIAQEYEGYGVKRVTLTRYLDNEALTCPLLAAFMEACRTSNDKRNRPDTSPPLTPQDLAQRSRDKRREAADKHMKRIAELLRDAPRSEHAEIVQSLSEYLRAAQSAEDF